VSVFRIPESLRLAGTFLAGASLLAAFASLSDSLFEDPNHPAIEYSRREARDPVALLAERMSQGEVRWKGEGRQGYLKELLDAFHIPVSSQIAIFSKTSVQMARIEPRNPRTLFFNDSVIVGYVRGGFLELAAQDPQQGVIFYTLQELASVPVLVRSDSCLSCHESYASVGVPGVFIRSVFPNTSGQADYNLGSIHVDHRTPFENRWGGYYLTGVTGPAHHMGNAMIAESKQTTLQGNILPDLRSKFDTEAYVSAKSDVVALMVFDHQMHGMNLLTRAGWEVRVALFDQQNDTGQRRLNSTIDNAARELADYLLFVDEARFEARVEGNSGFDKEFTARGPFDHRHRSLREFDLQTRLFRYPLSYLVYTPAFDALPLPLKAAIYVRLKEILAGADKDARYTKLDAPTRQAILEILRDTKAEFR
jgi:hypothetical protein